MVRGTTKFQIGKSGINLGVIESLNNTFKNHKFVRVSLLKSSGRDRDNMKKIAEDLTKKLNGNFKYTIIGFTIVMRRVGKMNKR